MSIRSRRFMLQGLATAGPAPLAGCVPRRSSGQHELVAPAPRALPPGCTRSVHYVGNKRSMLVSLDRFSVGALL
jgi:hypothetical protein